MISTISGDVDFIQRLEDLKFTGIVHSVFNRTFNIKCFENGELYTIASSNVDNGPNTIINDIDHFKSMEIKVNERVHVEKDILLIGNKLAVTINKAEKWESIIPAFPINDDILNRNLVVMRKYIGIHGKGGGIKRQVPNNPFEAEMSRTLNRRTNLLLDELAESRMSSAFDHAISIIGLGPGLTPSGDDFLVGVFTTFNMLNSPFYAGRSFCKGVVSKAKTLTNDISWMALKKASIGKVRESIISLLNALLIENEEDLILSLNKVLNIGSSSGTDIALGLVCGLEANIKAGGKVYDRTSFN
ncbi:DUF2877 domain-containing protein [Neobacillus sp. NRS-1170]|uniref:DUF2877 domain-containing protein n=1 Tax=Neobacillus sp. NRS-1170 TaxID=3233898 RepID=UPI003D27DD38